MRGTRSRGCFPIPGSIDSQRELGGELLLINLAFPIPLPHGLCGRTKYTDTDQKNKGPNVDFGIKGFLFAGFIILVCYFSCIVFISVVCFIVSLLNN